MDIQLLDLQGLDPSLAHVIITIDIRREMKPETLKKFVDRTTNTPLCKFIKSAGFQYTIVGRYPDGQTIQITVVDKENESKEESSGTACLTECFDNAKNFE